MKKILGILICLALCFSMLLPLEALIAKEEPITYEQTQDGYTRFIAKLAGGAELTISEEGISQEPLSDGMVKLVTEEKMSPEALAELLGSAAAYVVPDYPLTLAAEATPEPQEEQEANPSEASAAQPQPEGSAPLVAVIDTGIDTSHPGLEGVFQGGWDAIHDTASVHQEERAYDEWHGTHVSGIIAAQNPDVSILPIKIFEDSIGYTSDAIKAIAYAKGQGADSINMSFTTNHADNQALFDAVEATDALFVCAVGNKGRSVDDIALYSLPNVIPVAAGDGENGRLGFSNYCEAAVLAPGKDIVSTTPGNKTAPVSGTSQAAAYITGILSQNAVGTASLAEEKSQITQEFPMQEEAPVAMGQEPDNSLMVNAAPNSLTQAPPPGTQFGTWESIPYRTALDGAAFAASDNAVYRTGGYDITIGDGVEMKVPLDQITKYNTASHTWDAVGALQGSRFHHQSVAGGETLYTLGGAVWYAYDEAPVLTLEAYDFSTEQSAFLASAPELPSVFTPYLTDDAIYIIEPRDASVASDVRYDMLYYNIADNVWSYSLVMGGTVFTDGQTLYSLLDGQVYSYNTANSSWNAVAGLTIPVSFDTIVHRNNSYYGFTSDSIIAFTTGPYTALSSWDAPAGAALENVCLFINEPVLTLFMPTYAARFVTISDSMTVQATLYDGNLNLTGSTILPNESVVLQVKNSESNAIAYLGMVQSRADRTFVKTVQMPGSAANGEYVVTAVGEGEDASATASFSYTAANNDVHGDEPGVAYPVNELGTYPGAIDTAGDKDVFKLENLSVGANYILTLQTQTPLQFTMTNQYDEPFLSTGSIMAWDVILNAPNELRISFQPQTGTTYLCLEAKTAASTGAYTMKLEQGVNYFAAKVGQDVYYTNFADNSRLYKNETALTTDPVLWVTSAGNAVVYTSGGSLYKYDTQTGNSSKLVDVDASYLVSDGTDLYFSNWDAGGMLCKSTIYGDLMDLSTDSCSELQRKGEYVYYRNHHDGGALYKIKTDGTDRQKVE